MRRSVVAGWSHVKANAMVDVVFIRSRILFKSGVWWLVSRNGIVKNSVGLSRVVRSQLERSGSRGACMMLLVVGGQIAFEDPLLEKELGEGVIS